MFFVVLVQVKGQQKQMKNADMGKIHSRSCSCSLILEEGGGDNLLKNGWRAITINNENYFSHQLRDSLNSHQGHTWTACIEPKCIDPSLHILVWHYPSLVSLKSRRPHSDRVRHSNHSQARRALGSRRPHSNCVYRAKVYRSQLTYIGVTLSLPG